MRVKTRTMTQRQTEGTFRRVVLPAWKGKTVHEIRRRDVIELVERVASDRGGYTGNRTLAIISKFFSWLAARDVIAASPCIGVERPAKEMARERTLSDAEIYALWEECDAPVFGPFVKVLLLTGQRRGEVAGMKWSELHEAQRLWKLPAERTKNGKSHSVPLSAQAWDIIHAMPRIGAFVFSFDGERPITGFSIPKAELAIQAGVKDWRLHDLRRSAASGMQRLGARVEVIERALNHVSGTFRGVTGTYLRDDLGDEVRIALQKWADHVAHLVSGASAKVITLHGPCR